MAKKVRYGVAYEAYGYATTTVPDSVQTRDDATHGRRCCNLGT